MRRAEGVIRTMNSRVALLSFGLILLFNNFFVFGYIPEEINEEVVEELKFSINDDIIRLKRAPQREGFSGGSRGDGGRGGSGNRGGYGGFPGGGYGSNYGSYPGGGLPGGGNYGGYPSGGYPSNGGYPAGGNYGANPGRGYLGGSYGGGNQGYEGGVSRYR